MGRLFSSLISVILVSLVMLMFGGFVLDFVQHNTHRYDSFFQYRMRTFNDLPYWFVASLVVVAFNGLMLPKFARYVGNTNFSPFRQNGQVSWNIPVQAGILFGRNLALVCGLILLFLAVQSARI